LIVASVVERLGANFKRTPFLKLMKTQLKRRTMNDK